MNFSSSENTFYREDADELLATLMLRRRRRRRQRSQRGNSLPPTSDLFTFIAAPPLRTPPPPSPVSQRRAARWRRQYRPMMIVHVPVHARAADAGRTGRPLAAASRRRDHSGHACLAYRRRVITVSRRPRCRLAFIAYNISMCAGIQHSHHFCNSQTTLYYGTGTR